MRQPPFFRRRSVLLGLVIFSTALGSSPQASNAADPFYEEQLRKGRRAYEIGNHAEAAKNLRIGAFGLLDEPVALAEALVFLALAQAANDDRLAFEETFERVSEIEDRFSAYERLAEPAAKEEFEAIARGWIPEERLRITPGFEALARPIAATAGAQQDQAADRKSLRSHLKNNPEDVAARLQLARLELAAGRESKALAETERALAVEPTNAAAHCLRIGIFSAERRCDPALASLPLCPGAGLEPAYDTFVLGCMIEGERWFEARTLLESIPESRRSAESIAALEARVAEFLETHDQPPLESSVDSAAFAAEEQSDQIEPELSTADRVTIARVRQLIGAATRAEDLAEPTRLAFDLAARYSESREAQLLAAEVAYRGGRWTEAVSYFQLGGEPSEQEPLLLFYFAVSLFESGDQDRAAAALEAALPALTRTAFVDSYAERILGD